MNARSKRHAGRGADTADVIAPPPLIALATLALGLVLDWLVPIGAAGVIFRGALRYALAAIGLLLAGYIAVRAIRAFRRAGTAVEPWKPTTVLVTDDIFAQTRNPMYEALGIFLLGLAVGLASDWTALLLVPAVLVMHFDVVMREERYLEAKFGDAYRRYKEQVPRYGWPL
jgi:protein-S-isoprenylcysteine O-methyltransferase Ste14